MDNENNMQTPPDALTMSDEEFEKLDPSQFEYTPAPEQEADEPTAEDEAESTQDTVDVDDVDLEDESEDEPSEEEESSDDEQETDTEEDSSEQSDEEEASDEAEDEDEDSDEPGDEQPDASTQAVADLALIMAPFKANGREMKINTPEEAIRLMQQGANFNKKMAEIAPLRRTVKALTNAGIKTPEQLNYLLDLHNKNPEAINKLVKDAGIDPMEIDTEKESDYQPDPKNRVSNAEVELDQVLDRIEGSEAGQRTLKVIGSDWDDQSKQVLVQNPQVIEGIHDNIERGVFDIIDTEMSKQRALGSLNGLSDIEAYKKVGEAIQATGGFDHLQPASQQAPVKEPKAPVAKKTVKPSDKRQSDATRNQRRKAAGSTAGKSKGKAPEVEVNYLSMSDEEFEKQFDRNF